jgi:hypothetical protein
MYRDQIVGWRRVWACAFWTDDIIAGSIVFAVAIHIIIITIIIIRELFPSTEVFVIAKRVWLRVPERPQARIVDQCHIEVPTVADDALAAVALSGDIGSVGIV